MDHEMRRFVRTTLHFRPKYLHWVFLLENWRWLSSLTTRVPRLRTDLLSRLMEARDQSVWSATRTQYTSLPESSPTSRKREERLFWQNRLVETHDGKGFEGASCTTISSSWVSDGSCLMRGGAYVQTLMR
ncbi:hypothetical protein E2C01_102148 [Portunus trituberculatus]|uniref:Uncharacterized protein n=1 Tax=Portunus trituberculatus TaxID=210409 RepID=A0A5B7KBT8_PORTR|nr:hypothetical protein [Portunus trituberculatus]